MMFRRVMLALALSLVCLTPALAADKPNINTATAAELAALPGMDENLAKAVVSYREEMGDMQNMDELAEVPGMSKQTLDQLKENVVLDAVAGADCNC